jgi:pimeloyl-ACP methyl ester carboxylesterase
MKFPEANPSTLQAGYNRLVFPAARLVLLLLVAAPVGCASQHFLTRRDVPRSALAAQLKLVSRSGPAPTERTEQLLRRYGLARLQEKEPGEALARLQEQMQAEPSADKMYSYAELSFIQGNKLEAAGDEKAALDQYGASVAHSYLYLFDPGLDLFRNPYDPQFRRACDLYNSGLESAMRLANKQKKLRPGELQVIQTGKKQLHVQVAVRGPWRDEDVDRLEFVNDYEITNGLSNHHHTYGLGVPLIAVRRKPERAGEHEKYYPPGLSFATTAFLRVMPDTPEDVSSNVHRCLLELHDPQQSHDISVCNRLVPLETDLSTPLAHFLDDPAFRERSDATLGLLNVAGAQDKGLKGLYMLEPYDPKRIPVIMVHGLWSNPTTWMEMFNDLRFFPEIRGRFQFWFFQYPSGQPFWISAMQLRETLSDLHETLDPQHSNPNLDQLVLVGHSMGGLVSKMQTLESRDDFWHILSDRPFEELKIGAEQRNRLAKVVYFHPSPSVTRVITMGTPHRGSDFANDYTRLIGKKLIELPEKMLEMNSQLIRDNPDFFRDTELMTTTTSIDSLSPACPIFPVMLAAPKSPKTKFHNVVGVLPQDDWIGRFSDEGDGVVSLKSARLDDVASEVIVPADHMNVHRHPLGVLEVRRILLEHLMQLPSNALAAPPSGGFEPPLPGLPLSGMPIQNVTDSSAVPQSVSRIQ